MCNQKVLLALLTLTPAAGLCAEPLAQQGEAQAAAHLEQATQRIEREIQSKIAAELLADIEAKAGVRVVYQTARMLNRAAESQPEERHIARLTTD